MKLYRNKDGLIYSRQTAGLTQRELAEKAGLSVYTVQQIEQGVRGGAEETWVKLETVLEGGRDDEQHT